MIRTYKQSKLFLLQIKRKFCVQKLSYLSWPISISNAVFFMIKCTVKHHSKV